MDDPQPIDCILCGAEFVVEACVGGKCPKCGAGNFWQDAGYGLDWDDLRSRLALTRPIPVSERLPPLIENCCESDSVWAYLPTSEYWGEAWLMDTRLSDADELEWAWMNDRVSGSPSHWMPKPPKPE